MKASGLAAVFLVSTLSIGLRAQSLRGSVYGEFSDPSDRPLSGVQIRITEQDTNKERLTTTDAQGFFTIALLSPGTYNLEAEKTGFSRYRQVLTLQVNQEIRVVASMLPGVRSEQISVTAPREMLRTEPSAIGGLLDNLQVTALPLDGRNFYELALLLPGTAPPAQGSAGSVRGDFTVNVNGAREDGNNFLLDGVYNGDPKLNNYSVNPPVDAIREFEVLTSTYGSSFGRVAGGQVNVVLKSGSNRLHGSLYEFFRHSSLGARNYFAPSGQPDPAYQRNQFGGTAGGPIRKDRTFFFADYEGRRVREGITRTTNVPGVPERSGDFSRSPTGAFIIDPLAQQPFPGGIIPAGRIHPTGRNLANLYPRPNRDVPGQNFVSSPNQRDRDDRFDVRLDHSLGARSELTGRYSFGDRRLFEPFAGPAYPAVPGYGNDVLRRSQNAMLAETRTITPNLLNELRLAYNRVAFGAFPRNQATNLNQTIGLPVISANPRDNGLSLVTLTGYSPLGDESNNPQESVTNTYQFVDNLTWVRGRHLARFGFEFRKLEQNAYRDVQSRGFLNFLGMTGSSLAELLQGFVSVSGVAQLDNPQHLRTHSYATFVEDTWRLHPRLTLSLGLRYEFNAPPVDAFDRANIYDPATGGLVRVGTNGMPRGGFHADRNNWAPRVGLAWLPRAGGGTIIRSGYGVYSSLSALAPGEGLYFNAPYFDFRLYFPLPQMPLTLSDPFPRQFPVPVPSSALSMERNLRTAYMQHWNFGIQQRLGRGRVLEAAYVGSKGTKLLAGRDINQPRPSPNPFNPRPTPGFDDITALESRGLSNFHSLQARLEQRLEGGLSLLASYTLGKSIDDASSFFTSAGDANFPQDSANTRLERGRSDFDVRQRFSAAYVYELPFARRNRWLSGWQTSGVWTLQAGRPFSVALLSDLDNSNTGRSVLGFGAGDRPNRIASGALATSSPEQWFDTRAFALPPRGSFGNSGRNIMEGPGLVGVNVSLMKNIRVGDNVNIQFRAEAFNVLNWTNFDLPDIFLGSPSFGRVGSAQAPRRIQFGLKLNW